MRGRVPALITLKYERMLCSPFGFFRGAVPVMAADLALLPHTGIVNQICGDAHVRNLGAFAAPDGRLLFDINDFDETIRGPFEWDLKRLATSLVLACRESTAKSIEVKIQRKAVLVFVNSYRKLIQTLSRMPVIDVARYQVHRLQRISPVCNALLKAERSTPLHTLETLTVPGKKGRVFRDAAAAAAPSFAAAGAAGAGVGEDVSRQPAAGAAAFSGAVSRDGCGVQSGGDGQRGAARLFGVSRRQWGAGSAVFCKLRKNRGRRICRICRCRR